MGIQINGQTDRISAVDGSFSIQDLAEVNVTGVATASNFKSGTSNVHSTGYECTNINATGIVTAASANFTGNVSVGGTLTYQDVTNIDSVGIVTARSDIHVLGGTLRIKDSGNSAQRGAIYGDASSFHINAGVNNLISYSAGTERLRIDSSGRLLLACTTPPNSGVNAGLQIQHTSTANITLARNDSSISDGNALGRIDFYGNAGGTFEHCATIAAQADSAHAAGDKPMRLIFGTSADGAASPTERLRITSDGDLLIGTTSNGGGNRLYVVDNFTDGFINPSDSVLRVENANTSGTTTQASISLTSKTSGAAADSAIVSQAEDASGNASLQFWTDTSNGMSEKLRIHSNGSVTKPNNPAFLAGRTGGNQTFTVGTFPLNLARINVGNCWNTSTYKFTAPVAGIYYFFASVYYNDGAGQHRIHFRKTPNGGTAFQLCTVSHQAASNDDSKSMSLVESMAVGDTMELYSDQNAAVQCFYNLNNTTYGAHTYMMGYLIG